MDLAAHEEKDGEGKTQQDAETDPEFARVVHDSTSGAPGIFESDLCCDLDPDQVQLTDTILRIDCAAVNRRSAASR